jgi:NAD(P)-dependent dehydrogenase (short-subunit alcohol dehydrogenase family)
MNTLFEEYPLEKIEKLVQVDLLSPIYLAKFFLPHLKSSKGTIAVTSSIAGKSTFLIFRNTF